VDLTVEYTGSIHFVLNLEPLDQMSNVVRGPLGHLKVAI